MFFESSLSYYYNCWHSSYSIKQDREQISKNQGTDCSVLYFSDSKYASKCVVSLSYCDFKALEDAWPSHMRKLERYQLKSTCQWLTGGVEVWVVVIYSAEMAATFWLRFRPASPHFKDWTTVMNSIKRQALDDDLNAPPPPPKWPRFL